jgi:hypothetical protein
MTRASKRGIPEFIIQSRSPRLDMGREIPDTLFRWTPFLQERMVVAGLSMRFYLKTVGYIRCLRSRGSLRR